MTITQGSGTSPDQQVEAAIAGMMSGNSGSQADAVAIIDAVLQSYDLTNLSKWAWNEITQGASADQVTVDMTQTPQFKARFPGIEARLKAGLPPISPADYISYEDQARQLEMQYQLPSGFLDNAKTIGNWIGQDVSMSELTDRVQKGYSVVATAPADVRASFASMFGAAGDGALASYFMDEKNSVPLLEQRVTAAQLKGTAGEASVDLNSHLAMQLAQQGISQSQVQQAAGTVAQQSSIYAGQVGEAAPPTQSQGIEAALGTDQEAIAKVNQAQSAAEAAFKGGGGAESDQYGAGGVGPARHR
jgi:hypothetical protein